MATIEITEVGGPTIEIAVGEGVGAATAAHIADTTAAHAASAISFDDTLIAGAGVNVQAALSSVGVTTVNHMLNGTGAHAASAISVTPAGSVAATDVQAAIAELDAEKSATTHTHDAAGIVSGTIADARLPDRLKASVAAPLADANDATENGTYLINGAVALNAPGTDYYFLRVENSGGNKFQTAFGLVSDSGDTDVWRRRYGGGAWGAWYRLRWSEAELDARYVNTAGDTMTGALTIVSGGNLVWGTWTPTGTITTNITTLTPSTGKYQRLGDIISFSIYVAVAATAIGGIRFRLTLPPGQGSAFAALADLSGAVNSSIVTAGSCLADITNDEIDCIATVNSTTLTAVTVTGLYRKL